MNEKMRQARGQSAPTPWGILHNLSLHRQPLTPSDLVSLVGATPLTIEKELYKLRKKGYLKVAGHLGRQRAYCLVDDLIDETDIQHETSESRSYQIAADEYPLRERLDAR